MESLPFQLVEEPLYTTHTAELGDPSILDPVLAGVLWAIATHPYYFPLVHPDPPIRLAKTLPLLSARGPIPRLRIWYRIDHDAPLIHLLDIRRDQESDDDEWPV